MQVWAARRLCCTWRATVGKRPIRTSIQSLGHQLAYEAQQDVTENPIVTVDHLLRSFYDPKWVVRIHCWMCQNCAASEMPYPTGCSPSIGRVGARALAQQHSVAGVRCRTCREAGCRRRPCSRVGSDLVCLHPGQVSHCVHYFGSFVGRCAGSLSAMSASGSGRRSCCPRWARRCESGVIA